MPPYTVICQEHELGETKLKMAGESTRSYAAVMKATKHFVRVVSLSYPAGSGYTAGVAAPTAALTCVVRSGHSMAERKDMLQQPINWQFLSRRFRRAMPWKWGRYGSGRSRVKFSAARQGLLATQT